MREAVRSLPQTDEQTQTLLIPFPLETSRWVGVDAPRPEPGQVPVEPSKATSQFLRDIRPVGDNYVLNLATDKKDPRRFVCTVSSRWTMERSTEGEATVLDATSVDVPGGGKIAVRRPPGFMASAPYHVGQFFEQVPEAYCLNPRASGVRNAWIMAGTDVTVRCVRKAWGDNLRFGDENAMVMFRLCEARLIHHDQRALLAAAFKLRGEMPPMPVGFVDRDQARLSDYQKVALAFAHDREGAALYMDRGTGKTAVAVAKTCLEAREVRTREGRMALVLVICPAQVRANWAREFEKFATAPGQVVVMRGGKLKRVRRLVEGLTPSDDLSFGAVICSYESAVATIEYLVGCEWDLMITDESHMFKDSKTRRWRAVKLLRERSRRRLALTGTPVGNGFHDLWSQLEFLYEGASGFMSPNHFRSFYGKYVQLGNMVGVQKLVEVTNLPMLQERLAQLSFAVTKKEAGLNLPDKQLDVYEVAMTKRQAKVYQSMADDLYAKIEDRFERAEETREVTIENVLTQLLRLAQITSGHVTWDPVVAEDGTVIRPKRVEQIDRVNPKVDAVVEMLRAEDRDPLGKTIVWCVFVPDIEVLHARLDQEGIKHVLYYGAVSQDKRDAMVDAYNNDPTVRVMIANPQTAAEGLNLLGYDVKSPETSKTYTDHNIIFSQNWSMILRSQLEDRSHRRGTRVPVRITDLVVPDTIDEEIRARVVDKRMSADAIADLRAILRRVLGERDAELDADDPESDGIVDVEAVLVDE